MSNGSEPVSFKVSNPKWLRDLSSEYGMTFVLLSREQTCGKYTFAVALQMPGGFPQVICEGSVGWLRTVINVGHFDDMLELVIQRRRSDAEYKDMVLGSRRYPKELTASSE